MDATSTPVSEGFPATAGFAHPSRASIAFLGAGAAAIGVYFLLSSHTDAQAVWYVVIGLASVGAVCIGARRLEHNRVAWYLFAGGLLVSVAADAISGYYEIHLDHEPAVPSIADGFYLAGYPLIIAGIFLLLRGLGVHHSRAALLDSVIVTIAVATVQWIFFFDPYLHSSLKPFTRVVEMAYPTMDLLMLVSLSQLLLGVGVRVAAYQLLVVSVTLWVVGDEIFGLSVDNYMAGGWVDVFWLGSYVAWGTAALHPSALHEHHPDRRKVPRLTNRRLLLLAAAMLTVPVVIVVEHYWPDHDLHAISLAIGGALIGVLVVIRLAGLVRAVEGARKSERAANQRLRELDRLKDEFISTVSHELRTPLTSISGYVELVREQADEEARGYLDIVERNSSRLLALVNDLLFVARIQSSRLELDLEDVDLGALVADSMTTARPQAEAANIDLRLLVGSERARVRGDVRRLGQLVDNLISNAIKFSPEGGEVQLKLERRGGEAVLEVIDRGMGMTVHEHRRLFERFFRSQEALNRQIPGTGLGLYISRAIVEAHGGRISARSADGKGSSFVVELPAEEPS